MSVKEASFSTSVGNTFFMDVVLSEFHALHCGNQSMLYVLKKCVLRTHYTR